MNIRPHVPVLLIILIVVLSLFLPVLLNPGLILYPTFAPFSDTMVIHWPKANLMAQSWQAGEGLPLWNPHVLSGMPLAANQLAMLFYPPAWLFLIFPIEPTFNLLFIFHLLLGGLGLYFLLHRGHDLSPGAALLGSLTFVLNGKWLAHAAGGHVSLVGAIGWMPWVLLGVLLLLNRKPNISKVGETGAEEQGSRGAGEQRSRYLPRSPALLLPCILITIALAMQITTHSLPVIYSVYLIGAMVGWHMLITIKQTYQTGGNWSAVVRPYGKRLLLLAGAVALAGLLGAGQLLPLLELAGFSNRSLTLPQAAEYSVSPVQLLVGLLLPSTEGGHELVVYLGLAPLILGPFGLTRRRPWAWFYGGVLIFVVLFALGPHTPVHSLFYHVAPGFRVVRTPARIFFVGAIAVSALAAFAIERLTSVDWSASTQRWLARLVIVVSGAALTLGLGLMLMFGQLGRAPIALALVVPLGLSLILLRVRRRISNRRLVIAFSLLIYLDLASFDLSMMRFTTLPEALAQGRPVAEYLAQQPGLFRVYSPSYSLPVQTAAAHNLQLADGVEPVHLAAYDQFMARAGGYEDTGFSVTVPNFRGEPLETALQHVEPDLRLLGLLNVRYLVAAFPMEWPGLSLEAIIDDVYIYRNVYVLPRAWVSHQTKPLPENWLDQLEAQPNLHDVVFIERGPQLANGATPATPVEIIHYSANVIRAQTELTRPGWLVFSEIWYPGWQAAVNGSPQPVEKVNGLLRGVYIDQTGRVEITLTYRPRSVIWGSWLAGIAFVSVVVGLVFRFLRYQR